MLITFNLMDMFFKTKHVFKNKSVKLEKGPLNIGITKHFLIRRKSSPSQAKFRLHSFVVQLRMAPLEIIHFISTRGFFGGESNFITLNYQVYLLMGRSNSRFKFLLPDRSPTRSSTLLTNPSYRCWHQLFLP